MANPTERFSGRVENYVKYRPSYPVEVIYLLESECGLTSASSVADIGSGTGIFTRLLLDTGATVYGVEPNKEMRKAAEVMLREHSNFRSLATTAESTMLPGESMDLVVSAQAFHWFDPEEAKTEFQRIAKPHAYVALVWNDRHVDTSPFLREYEKALETYGTDYCEVRHRNIKEESHEKFFGKDNYKVARFPNLQVFEWEGFWGRVMSSSYAPEPGHPNHELLEVEARRIYDAYNESGTVSFSYTTEVYYGQIK